MKIKLGDLKVAMEGFTVLADKELPVKTAYWIGKTITKLEHEFRDLEANRQKLCLKHCVKDEDDKPVLEESDGRQQFNIIDMESFNVELMELYNVEIDIDFKPIPIDQIDGIKIDSMTLMKLERFIVGE